MGDLGNREKGNYGWYVLYDRRLCLKWKKKVYKEEKIKHKEQISVNYSFWYKIKLTKHGILH